LSSQVGCRIQGPDISTCCSEANLWMCAFSGFIVVLQREDIIEEKAQQQHAAALGTYSPWYDSPPVTKPCSSAGAIEPVRGVACMMSPAPYVHPAGRSTCMPDKGLGAHGCLHAPGMRAAYVL
jgi:hypothetical protein